MANGQLASSEGAQQLLALYFLGRDFLKKTKKNKSLFEERTNISVYRVREVQHRPTAILKK